jgi:hypothetical protein
MVSYPERPAEAWLAIKGYNEPLIDCAIGTGGSSPQEKGGVDFIKGAIFFSVPGMTPRYINPIIRATEAGSSPLSVSSFLRPP